MSDQSAAFLGGCFAFAFFVMATYAVFWTSSQAAQKSVLWELLSRKFVSRWLMSTLWGAIATVVFAVGSAILMFSVCFVMYGEIAMVQWVRENPEFVPNLVVFSSLNGIIISEGFAAEYRRYLAE